LISDSAEDCSGEKTSEFTSAAQTTINEINKQSW